MVFLCTYGLHTDTKSSKTSQSRRKTPQNGRFSTVPTVEAICENLPKIYKKSASSYHTQTGYISFLFKTHQFCLKPMVFCFKTHHILFKTHHILFKTHFILFKTKIYERKYKKSASSFHTQIGHIIALDCSGKSFYLKASWDTHVFQTVWKKTATGGK